MMSMYSSVEERIQYSTRESVNYTNLKKNSLLIQTIIKWGKCYAYLRSHKVHHNPVAYANMP